MCVWSTSNQNSGQQSGIMSHFMIFSRSQLHISRLTVSRPSYGDNNKCIGRRRIWLKSKGCQQTQWCSKLQIQIVMQYVCYLSLAASTEMLSPRAEFLLCYLWGTCHRFLFFTDLVIFSIHTHIYYIYYYNRFRNLLQHSLLRKETLAF